MAMEKKKTTKKQKHSRPNDQTTTTTDITFKPSSDVKGLKFGGQFIVKSFTIRRANHLQLLSLLSLHHHQPPPPTFPSTIAFLPTNFTILAHHAWHTLTLGLGTKKSKVLILVFESEPLKSAAERIWPPEIPLGDVNRKMIRGLNGCELARFKFRKGCVTFYVYAVRRQGTVGFGRADDLRLILQSVVQLNDFLDHTAMLARPNHRSIGFGFSHVPPVAAMAQAH
ncbi:hypothetical protein Dimus_023092 [Dionaea muscipula]